jgi:hypothetical protein
MEHDRDSMLRKLASYPEQLNYSEMEILCSFFMNKSFSEEQINKVLSKIKHIKAELKFLHQLPCPYLISIEEADYNNQYKFIFQYRLGRLMDI